MTGFPEIKRKSIFHALNHKYVARQYALSVRRPYEELNISCCPFGRWNVHTEPINKEK